MNSLEVSENKLFNRNDRLGANLSSYIAQIIYYHYNKIIIPKIENDNFSKSFFLDVFNESINKINSSFDINNYQTLENFDSWCDLNMRVCLDIKQDLYSYFREHIYTIFNESLSSYSNIYNLDYLPEKTICVHLRLDDVDFNNRIDYDGSYSSEFYRNKINKDIFDTSNEIDFYLSKGIKDNFNLMNCQSPMKDEKILKVLNECKLKYPEHKVIIVASPIGNVTLTGDLYIRTNDENHDLYCLINSDILICSRSTYSLVAAYLHRGTKIYLPMWGHFASTGLTSKYDKTKLEYFY